MEAPEPLHFELNRVQLLVACASAIFGSSPLGQAAKLRLILRQDLGRLSSVISVIFPKRKHGGFDLRRLKTASLILVLVTSCLFAQAQQRRAQSPAPTVESVLQEGIKACDRINTRRSACAARAQAPLAQVKPTPVPEALKRCDPKRADAPTSMQVQNHQQRSFEVSSVSLEEANQVFAFVKPQRTRYGMSGESVADRVCAQRAQIMAYDLLDQCKMKTAKVFIQPSRSRLALGLWRNSLHVQANGESYRWDNYHVANVIYVRQNGKDEPYVIDPLLFQGPVPQAQWEALVRTHDPRATTTVTSASTYTLSGADKDDPSQPLNTRQAELDLAEARRIARQMRGN